MGRQPALLNQCQNSPYPTVNPPGAQFCSPQCRRYPTDGAALVSNVPRADEAYAPFGGRSTPWMRECLTLLQSLDRCPGQVVPPRNGRRPRSPGGVACVQVLRSPGLAGDGRLVDADHADPLRVARLRALDRDPDDARLARLHRDRDLAVLAGLHRLVDPGARDLDLDPGDTLLALRDLDRDLLRLAVGLQHLRGHRQRVADLGLHDRRLRGVGGQRCDDHRRGRSRVVVRIRLRRGSGCRAVFVIVPVADTVALILIVTDAWPRACRSCS